MTKAEMENIKSVRRLIEVSLPSIDSPDILRDLAGDEFMRQVIVDNLRIAIRLLKEVTR